MRKKIIVCILITTIANIICLVPHLKQIKVAKYCDLSPYIEKMELGQVLTTEEYQLITHQTGLGKTSIDVLIASGEYKLLIEYQNDYLFNREYERELFFLGSYQEVQKVEHLDFIDVRRGDIIIASGSYTLGFRHGHAGIVTNAYDRLTIEAYNPFDPSDYGSVSGWLEYPNIMLMRVKEEYRDLASLAADYARDYLYEVKYSIFASTKDYFSAEVSPKRTQCSHLVWAAYKAFGLDLNSDGGWLVTAQDLSRSPYLEAVEVKGFNFDDLW